MQKRRPTKVAVVEVGDHDADVFTVPLDGIDEFIRDNRREYDFGLAEMGMELGTSFLSVGASTGAKTLGTVAPASSGDALFVKSTPSTVVKSVVMAPTASATLAAEKAAKEAAARKAAEAAAAAAKKAANDAAAAKKAADEAAAKKKADEAKAAAAKPSITGVIQQAANAVTAAVKQAVIAPMASAGASAATAANAINAALAASVGQTNKAPTIAAPTTFTTAPKISTASSSGLTLSGKAPSVSLKVSGSVSTSAPKIAPTVQAALIAPTSDIIQKAAASLAAQAAGDALFKPVASAPPKSVVMAATPSATLAAAKIADTRPAAVIAPAPVITSKIDPGPYLVMKDTPSATLAAAKIAEDRPLTVLNKVASLAPDVSAMAPAAVKALADAAMGVLKADAAQAKPLASMLEQLAEYGGKEKCACIVARKKQGLSALGTQIPTLRGQLPKKTFVSSNRVDFQGQVLSELQKIEQNTSSQQLRDRLKALRLATGVL